MTCQRRPGSLHYETKDANTYADWGVDYLKLDSCNLDNTPAEVEIGIMRDALNASGRPIFFSICGMHTNCYTLYIFLLKVVLAEEIHWHQVLETVGEQQPIFKIIGRQCWPILIV